MSNTIKKLFGINLKIIQFFGYYPPNKNKILYKIYSWIMYWTLTVPVPIITLTYLLKKENVDLELISQNAFAICETTSFVLKLFQFILNSDKIHLSICLVDLPIFDVLSQKSNTNIDLLNDCINECTRNVKFFVVFCIAATVSWAIVPFYESGYKLPLDVWVPFDYTHGGPAYTWTFAYLVIAVGANSVVMGAIEPLIGGMALYAATQIKILKNNLENIGTSQTNKIIENKKFGEVLIRRIICRKIKHCIEHHNAILDFVKIYEDTFSPMIFTQLCASVLVICISCLRLGLVEPFTVDFFSMIIFLCAVATQIFFYCYYGTCLYEETNSLPTAVYMSNWYEYDVKAMKSLLILMTKAKKPLAVKAGYVLDLSLDTFTAILKRAYSLLAVIKNY